MLHSLFNTHTYIYIHILSEVLYLLEGIAPSQILLAYHAALARTYYALFLKGLLLVIEFPFQAQCCFSPEFTSLKTFFDQKNLHILRGITLWCKDYHSLQELTHYGRTLSERECCSVAIACNVALSQWNAALSDIATVLWCCLLSKTYTFQSPIDGPFWKQFCFAPNVALGLHLLARACMDTGKPISLPAPTSATCPNMKNTVFCWTKCPCPWSWLSSCNAQLSNLCVECYIIIIIIITMNMIIKIPLNMKFNGGGDLTIP